MPVHDLPEDGRHGVVVKLVHGDGVKVAQETRGHGVTTSTCHTDNNQGQIVASYQACYPKIIIIQFNTGA